MSTKQTEINDKNVLSTFIKLENDTDDDLTYDNSSELNQKKDSYSTSTNINPSLSLAYKGKIEVTSKGRRKIFDGVRWQILCRRPECRKQTNKKSLCITHYKEEYESNIRTSSSWSINFQVPSYQQQQHSFDHTKNRLEIEDQNNTISTTNNTDNDEQLLLNSNNNRSLHEGYIKYLQNGRRFILKNNKWQPLCKYDHICRNIAKLELLCIKHYELTQQKQRHTFKIHNKDHQRSLSSIFDNHHLIFSNNNTKRLKSNDFQTSSSSSVTEQFDINSNENNYTSTSKPSNHQIETSSKKNLNIISTDKSIQTDITIPLCCIIHQEDHSFNSLCKNKKSTSSILSYGTKSEPQSLDTSFSI